MNERPRSSCPNGTRRKATAGAALLVLGGIAAMPPPEVEIPSFPERRESTVTGTGDPSIRTVDHRRLSWLRTWEPWDAGVAKIERDLLGQGFRLKSRTRYEVFWERGEDNVRAMSATDSKRVRKLSQILVSRRATPAEAAFRWGRVEFFGPNP